MLLWHGLTGSDGAVFAEMLQQYAKANPEACFESQGIPWDLFFQKYPTAVAAGTPPDMVIFHAAEVSQMAAEGLMQPMDDFYHDQRPRQGPVQRGAHQPDHGRRQDDGRALRQPRLAAVVQHEADQGRRARSQQPAQERRRVHRVGAEDHHRHERQAPDRRRLRQGQRRGLGHGIHLAALHHPHARCGSSAAASSARTARRPRWTAPSRSPPSSTGTT